MMRALIAADADVALGCPSLTRMEFTTEELRWISRSLNEVSTGGGPIGNWEFDVRIGSDVEEVRTLLRRVNEELRRRDS